MRHVLDAVYAAALLVLSPWLLMRALRTGRYRRGLREKLLGAGRSLPPGAVWFHGVSLGEIHLLRPVLARFRERHPGRACVVSTTTEAGYDGAKRVFPDLEVFFFPFDFSRAVDRALDRVRPCLVVLAESELWPNFLLAAERRGVPVALLNARMSPRSLARYRLVAPLTRWVFRSFRLVAAQTTEYAAAFLALGAVPGRVVVTGSVKFDGVLTDRANPRTAELRRLLRLAAGETVWVAGSTQAPEEAIVLGIYRKALADQPGLRLVLVPRSPDRFDEVARLLERAGLAFARRSRLTGEVPVPAVVLLDTVGELGALWGVADVAFVGGSLDGRRGGQNMIEPAAFGAAVVFGPHVWNFKEPARRLVEVGGAVQVRNGAELEGAVLALLADAGERRARGAQARAFALAQQGATERTVELLTRVLAGEEETKAA